MKSDPRLVIVLLVGLVSASCTSPWGPTPTPLPGWRSPVSDFFVDESAFPEGWRVGYPENASTDPTINHVWQEWWGPPEESCLVGQSIWRGYTARDVEGKFDSLRRSQFKPSRPLPPDTLFVPFEPPAEIGFRSEVADEFYLACGWWRLAYCEVIARYRNYVVELWLDREAVYEGHVSQGLTYPEIERVIRAMDARFAQGLETLPAPPP